VDMAHFAGLVAGGAHAHPFPHADVVTTTTYKSLRGPRGAIILWNEESLRKQVNNAVFPGMQGTPSLHLVAAKAVALGEALRPEFADYARAVLVNARTLARRLQAHGFDLVGGGTDTPLMLVDLRAKGLTGAAAAQALERAGIIANMNPIPADAADLKVMSGLRFGVSGATTRGLGGSHFEMIGDWAAEVLEGLRQRPHENGHVEERVRSQVRQLAADFPTYG
jgi:glycine hydroxymethyltransferase